MSLALTDVTMPLHVTPHEVRGKTRAQTPPPRDPGERRCSLSTAGTVLSGAQRRAGRRPRAPSASHPSCKHGGIDQCSASKKRLRRAPNSFVANPRSPRSPWPIATGEGAARVFSPPRVRCSEERSIRAETQLPRGLPLGTDFFSLSFGSCCRRGMSIRFEEWPMRAPVHYRDTLGIEDAAGTGPRRVGGCLLVAWPAILRR